MAINSVDNVTTTQQATAYTAAKTDDTVTKTATNTGSRFG